MTAPSTVTRYFTVGPIRDRGDTLVGAIRQLGGDDTIRRHAARGLVVIRGGRFFRLGLQVTRAEALEHFAGPAATVGEAVAVVGDQVIYQALRPEPVHKRIDPRTPAGFLRIVDRVGGALRGVSREAEADAVRAAIDRLDVDWPNLDAEARAQVVRAANQALAGLPARILPRVDEVLGVEADKVIVGTRGSVKRTFGFKIEADPSALDQRITRFVRESQSNFVRDEYGRRSRALSVRARQIVSVGVAEGLGRAEIADQLREAFTQATASRNTLYWDVVASAFVNRARSLAEVSSYQDAGITHYVISATLDEATTDVCRFLDGKRFVVGAAIEQFKRVERLRDPERVKVEQPWLHVRQDPQGRRGIFVRTADTPVRVAIVEDSAEIAGLRDERGTFRSAFSPTQLAAHNIGPPPYHGLCRTLSLPEV